MVQVPPELALALDGGPDAKAVFDALSYTHRKEFAQRVREAKKEETRMRRAWKSVEMLREGKRR